jgi:hypothetical protein
MLPTQPITPAITKLDTRLTWLLSKSRLPEMTLKGPRSFSLPFREGDRGGSDVRIFLVAVS